MASIRETKLRRLNDFRRTLPHVSVNALAKVIQAIAEGGLPDLHSKSNLMFARNQVLDKPTPYGQLLVTQTLVAAEGDPIPILVVNPFAMLYTAFLECEPFRNLMLSKMAANPSSPEDPWNLILYSDEVVPGNPLGVHNDRKVWVIYFSFLEFGPLILQREDAWICVLSQRSSVVNSVSAGISQVFGSVLKLFFGGQACDISTGGIVLKDPNGNQHRLWAKLGMMLQDGAAHKSCWHCKGDAGTKLCMLCLNLVRGIEKCKHAGGCTCNTIDAAKSITICTNDAYRAYPAYRAYHIVPLVYYIIV